MKKIFLLLICFSIIFSSLASCSFSKDITEIIAPYFSEGSSFEGGIEFDNLSVKAKITIAEETSFTIISEGNLYGTELRYTADTVKISFGEAEFTHQNDKYDPLYEINGIFKFLARCTFDEKNAALSEIDGAIRYIFDFSDGEKNIRFVADKASCTPHSVEAFINGKRIAVYFH